MSPPAEPGACDWVRVDHETGVDPARAPVFQVSNLKARPHRVQRQTAKSARVTVGAVSKS
jgi:hypothetical protein